MNCEHELDYEYGTGQNEEYFSTCRKCGERRRYYYPLNGEYLKSEIIKEGKMELTPEQIKEREQRVIERYKRGDPIKDIARDEGKTYDSFVYDILHKYGIPLRGYYPRIIDIDDLLVDIGGKVVGTVEHLVSTDGEVAETYSNFDGVDDTMLIDNWIDNSKSKDLHLAIQALLEFLPEPGSAITREKRVTLNDYFCAMTALIYTEAE